MTSLPPNDPHGYTDYHRVTKVTLQKSTRHTPVRPVAPRLPDIKWTEFDDNALLASPSLVITGKTKVACTRRLTQLRREAAERERAYESFTFFPKLPFELQMMIWELAAAEPRVVEVHSVSLSAEMEPTHHPNWSSPTVVCPHFRSRTFDPPLLSTCALSRSVALNSRFFSKRDLSHALLNDGVYLALKHDIAFLSATTMEQWFVKASRTFYRRSRQLQERVAFPALHPGPSLKNELRTLAIDAGFFLARGGPCVDANGANVRKQREGGWGARVEVWNHVWGEIKLTFRGVRTLILVLGDEFPAELGDRCFGAMRLEEAVEEPGKSELEALRNRFGEWKNRNGIDPIHVKVRLARVRSYGKNSK